MNYDVSTWNKLIQLEDFQWVLKSILEIGDDQSEWKADFINFVNSETSDAQSSFYYDMLPFVRFTDEGPEVGAYTTPDHLIWMNAPHGFNLGQQDFKWEFIYCHECLHQLWDTFGVEDNIKRQFGECDREILNIASDCVINDFLNINKKMPYPTDGLITPEYLEKKYGIIYDRKQDTQFSLYEKLLKVADQIKRDNPQNNQPNQDAQGKKHQNGSQGNSGGGGNAGNQKQGNQNGNGNGGNGNQKGNQQNGNGGNGNGNGQKQGNQNGNGGGSSNQNGNGNQQGNGGGGNQNGNGNTGGNQSGNGGNQSGNGGNGTDQGNGNGNGNQGGNRKGGHGNLDKFTGFKPFGTEPSSTVLKQMGDKLIRKYGGKISGAFGEFVRKCKASTTEEKKEGMVVRQRRGAAWHKQLDKMMDSFIQQEVIDKHREFEHTYHRVKRGTKPIQMGDILKKGKRLKDDKLNITMSFFIDRSGSMGDDSVDRCFDLANQLAEKEMKAYRDDKVVGDVGCRFFAFNDYISDVPKGQSLSSSGGTMPLSKLIDYISKNTADDLINIIITDAEFNIEKSAITKLMKDMHGMVFLIANQPKPECEEIERLMKGQFVFLQADSDFSLK